MDQASPYYLSVLLFGGAGILTGLYIFFRRWGQQRLVEDTPEARIRSAPQGYVKLNGRARSMDGIPQRAPLSGRSCVWWSYRVERRQHHRLEGISWHARESGTSDQPFLLIDQNDQCQVDPQGAEVEPSERKVWYGDSPEDVPLALMGGLNVGFGADCRYIEAIICEDAQLAIMGEFRASTNSITNALEDEAAVLLDQWKHNQKALLTRFDVNHDGRIDAAEWEAARAAALTEARENRIQQAPQQRVSVLGKPGAGQPFLIAAQSAEQLARTERRRAISGLAIALLSLVITCYAIAHGRAIDDRSKVGHEDTSSR